MAVIRQFNAQSQIRFDVPHLRSIESAVAADFDVLAGQMLAGQQPLVLKGFKVVGAVSAPASSLEVAVAGSLLLHYGASEAGTLFQVPDSRSNEVLTPGSQVVGTFAASATNYVGLDLLRSADASTSDSARFINISTGLESGKTIPLGRTLDYRLVVSTTDFSARTNILPLAIVSTDSANNVTAIVDARQLMFRLGSGGDFPEDGHIYPWATGRQVSGFGGADKDISSLKQWLDVAMTRLWELGGGEHWYSPTADRNVTLVWTGTTFSNGENYEWDGTNLHWKGLKFLFDNSSVSTNTVQDQTSNSAGLTDLADGECLYVDLDRASAATLVPAKAALATLGTPAVPGSRYVIAWRLGSSIYTRNWKYAVGTTFTPASTTALGVVRLNATPGSDTVVPAIQSLGQIVITATGASFAIKGTGFGTGAGIIGIGGDAGHGGEFTAGADPMTGLVARGYGSTDTTNLDEGQGLMVYASAGGGNGAEIRSVGSAAAWYHGLIMYGHDAVSTGAAGAGGYAIGGNGLTGNAYGGYGFSGQGGNGVGTGNGGAGIVGNGGTAGGSGAGGPGGDFTGGGSAPAVVGHGVIQSTTGGIKFPDNSVQTISATSFSSLTPTPGANTTIDLTIPSSTQIAKWGIGLVTLRMIIAVSAAGTASNETLATLPAGGYPALGTDSVVGYKKGASNTVHLFKISSSTGITCADAFVSGDTIYLNASYHG